MKRYSLTAVRIVLILIVSVILFKVWNVKADEVTIEYNNSGYDNRQMWNLYISANVNVKPLYVYVNSHHIEGDFYMSMSMELMVPYKKISECFDCAANLYDGNELVIQRNNTVIKFPLQEQGIYYINNERFENSKTFETVEGEIYISADIIADNFGYDHYWNVQANVMDFIDKWNGDSLPKRYSLLEARRSTAIKNQGSRGTCWAVAALSALETTLQPEENYVFSAEHMALKNSFTKKIDDGGEYTMSMSYLLGWQGPVLEESDPYGDLFSPDGLSAVKHVQEVQIIKNKDIQKIKYMIFTNGAVQSSFYTSMKSSLSSSQYYNKETNAYYFNGNDEPNHDIIIIGWDDDFPKENFKVQPQNNGAFICQNSWGTNFGDNGIFYISYEDSKIGSQSVAYTKVENTNNYDNIYQTDLCGWVGQIGYGKEYASFANVFTAKGREIIKAVGFYTLDENTSYEVYKVSDFTDAGCLEGIGNSYASNENSQLIAAGSFENPGFYTVDLHDKFQVEAGQRFAIVIQLYAKDAVHPVAVEYAVENRCENVDLSDGEGYISYKGEDWINVESEYNCNVCMKVYSNDFE